MSSAGRNSISSCFQHGLQDGYLSLKPHVKGGLFPISNWITESVAGQTPTGPIIAKHFFINKFGSNVLVGRICGIRALTKHS